MTDKHKTKQELIQELDILRQRVAALEQSESARKRAEEALRGQSDFLRQLLNAIPIPIAYKSRQGIYLGCNTAFLKFYGLSEKQVLGKTVHEVFPRDLADRYYQADSELFRRPGEQVYESEAQHPDGSRHDIIQYKATYQDTDGHTAGLISAFLDITERKRAEEMLRGSEGRYKRLIDSVTDYIYTVQIEDGRPVATSHGPGCLAVTGYTSDEFLTDPYLWYHIVHAKERDAVTEQAARVSAGKTTTPLEHRIVHRDGSIRWVRNTPVPHYDEHGRLVAYDGLITNITERKEVEATANRLAREDSVLAEIGRIISSTLNIEEVYKLFSEKVGELIPFDRIGIAVISTEESTVSFPYIEGISVSGRQPGDIVSLAGTATEKVMQTRKSLLFQMEREEEIAREVPGLLPEFHSGIRSALTVPLVSRDQVIGVLSLRSTIPRHYTERDLRLAESIGNQIAGAIANVQLYGRLRETEESLRRSEGKFRELFDSAPVGYHEFDMEGRITNVNRTDQEILGYSREELIGEYIWKVTLEEDIAHRDVLEKLAGHRPLGHSFERTYRRKDGTTVPVLLQDRLNKDEQGRITGMRITVQDITEQKQTEEALRESEERYRRLVELSPEAIFVQIDGRFAYLNPQATKLFHLSAPEEAIGRSVFDFYHPDYHDLIRQRAQQIREIGKPIEPIEQKYVRSDGQIIDVEVTGAPITYKGKQGILTVARDISDRKRAKEALIKSEERFRDLFDHAPVGYFELDSKGQFSNLNQTELEILGYSLEEMIGQPVWKFYKNEETVRKRVLDKLAGVEPPAKGLEDTCRRKNGTTVHVLIEDRLLKDSAGEIIGLRGTIQDITDRRKAAQEVGLLQEQLHQAQKMEAIGTLAGGIAHDFNNILSVILGYADLVNLEIEEGSKAKRNLQHSMKAAHRAKDLVQQLLSFSRQRRQERKPLDIRPIIKEGLSFLHASLPATIEIRENIEEELGPVEADPTEVHQVLMNLCTNAAHAMDEKGGVLEVLLDELEVEWGGAAASQGIGPGIYVRLRVSDTGHGMSPEILKRIFDPYFTTKEVGKGTGLGLAVVHGIVKNYGGGITVSSDVGKGSTFDIYFPRIETMEVSSKADPVEPFPLGSHERVLFVDDEKAIAEVGREVLEHLRYEVVTRTSSIEALELFRSQGDQFDLVITDMTMPNMTGDKLAQELLKIRPGIPIILCTGFSEHITEEKAKAIGIREFAMKPLVMKDLAKAIRRVLEFKKQ